MRQAGFGSACLFSCPVQRAWRSHLLIPMADPEQTKSLEDAASDEEDGWPEGECGLCNQKFQSQDED